MRRSTLTLLLALAILAIEAPARAGETPLVLAGSDWRYLDGGVPPDADWIALGYDDAGWAVGAAPLGYGMIDIVTPTGYGADPNARYITTWFRQTFSVADPDDFDTASVHLRRDDGAVVYLNGTEILRSNLPEGPVDAETRALAVLFGEEQTRFVDAVVPPDLLRAGDNVVAVEVHQQAPSSPDLVMDLRLSGWDGPTAVTRGPYLQMPTPTGVRVRWRTDGPSAGQLLFGSDPGPLDRAAVDPEVGFEHELEIYGMPPGSRVRYAVGTPRGLVLAGNDPDHVLRLPPPTGGGRPLRIWVLGDSGTANVDAEAVRDAYLALAPDPLDTDLWLMLGDNAYGSGTLSEYQEAVFDFYPSWLRQVPLWPALGNHDAYSSTSATQSGPFFDLFTLPVAGECGGVPSGTEAYYSFDHGRVHFLVLDSADSDLAADGAMAVWAEADLASLPAGIDWVIALFHHPPYSRGSHDSDRETELVEMRENLLPTLEAGGVDLVLTGHSHSYERSFLLDGHYGDSTTFDPVTMVRQDHDGDPAGGGAYTKWPEGVEGHEGAVYVVAGSSGQISGGRLDHPAMYTSLAALGSLVLDIDGLTLQARFLDDVGAILDTFTIDKGRTTIVSIDGPRLAASGETITLTGLALQPDGREVPTYLWDWGDGSAPSALNPASHAWAAEGAYTVRLTVTDDAGEQASDTALVYIDDYPPVIDQVTVSDPALEGSPVTFTAVATDSAGDPLTYAWTIDDSVYLGDTLDHVFYEDGIYPVLLTVTDDAGRQASRELSVSVANAPPAIEAVAIPDAVEAEAFVLAATVSDPAGFYDPLVTEWTLPDGTVVEGLSAEVTFDDDGIWPVLLAVTDDAGASTQQLVEVPVRNLPPAVVDPTFEGTTEEGAFLVFGATGVDPSPVDTVSLSWSFDDSTSWVDGETVQYAFGDQGTHRVWVAASDDDGGIGFASLELTLTNVPPTILGLDLPQDPAEGVPAPWAVRVEDPGYDDVITAIWSFGDGERGEGVQTEHTLPDEGTYAGWVEVTDDEGEGESMPFTITARNLPPVFVTSPPSGRVAPGGAFVYLPEVSDVDPIALDLSGPLEATLDPDGTVRWTAPNTPGLTYTFALTASDGDGGATTQSWTLVVAGEPDRPEDRFERQDAIPYCSCGASPRSAPWSVAWLGLLALARRRR